MPNRSKSRISQVRESFMLVVLSKRIFDIYFPNLRYFEFSTTVIELLRATFFMDSFVDQLL